ncbi:MAG: hypothetical protein ACRCSO_05125 [Sphingomonas sp.]
MLLLIAAAPRPLMLSDIRPIAIKPGVNRIADFLPTGGAATIIDAWLGNGNAHGHHSFMVLTGASEGEAVGLAPFPDRDTLTDNPFDGERVIGAVRFVRARVDGRVASLVVTATLDQATDRPLADHALATVRVYRLTKTKDGIGPPLFFEQVSEQHSTSRYCNAHLALRDVLGVPLPRDYAGANRVDGCFSG